MKRMSRLSNSITLATVQLMSRPLLLLFCLLFLSQPAQAQRRQSVFQALERQPAAPAHSALAAEEQVAPPLASFFTLGTFFGLGFNLYDSATYRVDSLHTVVAERPDGFDTRLLPATFVLPSLKLGDAFGRDLSVILPAGFSGRTLSSVAGGLGLSLALSEPDKSYEAGLALALIWSSAPALSSEQRLSFVQRTPLPDSSPRSIASVPQPSLMLGVYVAPRL
jgi:hypothetical protein